MKHRILAIVCSIAAAFTASAQVPSLINYQGRLTDSNGAPVTGSKNFAISIYDAATGGNLLYEETIGAVTLDANGVYSFQFGSAGSSSTQVTETIGTTAGSTLTYSKTLTNTPVVNNSITVTDGTNSWSQSVGNPGVGATATANTISGFVIGATITNGGSGYTSAPAVTITGAGSGATATATISGGVVTAINITSAGIGYTGGATITIAPPVIPFRVNYSGGTITATYAAQPLAGQTISATYRYNTSTIFTALSASSEQWLQLSVDGVNQVPRQRVLAVPFALNAANAVTANSANTVADGAITATKFSPNAIIEATVNQGNLMVSKVPRPDLISQGYQLFNVQGNTFNRINPTNTPVPRSEHIALWTGTEMIVWGGTDYSGAPGNTGARYNPTTNSWTDISITNAPIARYGYTTVWTGAEMVVWGGALNNGSNTIYFNTGARYNPTTNSWTDISTISVPTARIGHTTVWTGTEMIIWGGRDAADNLLNTGARYNPTTNTWTDLSTISAPTTRIGHSAVWTGTEMIIWGGRDAADNLLNTGARYNPTTNTWTDLSTISAPTTRIGHSAVWTGTEMIIWGGRDDADNILNTGALYNPTSDIWTAMNTTTAPNGRIRHTALWTGTEMFIWGGYSSEGGDQITGTSYNPATNIWNKTLLSEALYIEYIDYSIPVWTGTEIIVWGGANTNAFSYIFKLVPGNMYFYSR